jgi:hypothetical protein
MLGGSGNTDGEGIRAWNELKVRYSRYSSKIDSLHNAFETAYATIRAYSAMGSLVDEVFFREVADPMAKFLLGIVFLSRISKGPGYIDYDVEKGEEFQNLCTELNVPLDSQGLLVSTVVEAVLEDRLRVTYQEPGSAVAEIEA